MGETVKENGGSQGGVGVGVGSSLYIKHTLKTSEIIIILPSLLHHHYQWQFSFHLLRPCTAVEEEVGVIISALHSQAPLTM